MSTRENALHAGAELLAEQAKEIGMRVGLGKETAAVQALEEALGVAYADACLFLGANDTPERLEETVRIATTRVAMAIRTHHFLRLGSKPGLITKGH